MPPTSIAAALWASLPRRVRIASSPLPLPWRTRTIPQTSFAPFLPTRFLPTGARASPSAAALLEEPQAVEGHGYRGPHIGQDRHPERYQSERSEQHEQALDEDRDGHVLPDDPLCGAREHDRLGQFGQVVL